MQRSVRPIRLPVTWKVLPDKSDVPVKTNRSEVTLLRDGKIKVNQAERKALKSLEDQ